MFTIIILCTTIFMIVLVMFKVYKNDKVPILTVEAVVVDTREEFHPEFTTMIGNTTPAHTTYHVVFEVESGDRLEFSIPYPQYSALAKGQFGRLTFQGKRLGSFIRC